MKRLHFNLTSIVLLFALMPFAATSQTKPQPMTQEAFEALCPTPPMGWNSWNKFGCNVSEQLLMEAADALVASGMKDAGYEYIVVDDCWQIDRDADGNIVCDAEIRTHLVFLEVLCTNHNHNLKTVAQLLEHTQFAVRLESRQHT